MLTNRTKAALAQGQSVIGTILDICPFTPVVRILAKAGYDYLFIDTEHGNASRGDLFDAVQVCRACNITPIVRVAAVEYPLIARALDMGAQGIIIPRVESRQEVEQVIEYSRLPPQGNRGFGTFAPLDFVPENLEEALPFLNDQILTVVQIESVAAVENADEILSGGGVDVAFIGPVDLSISLGIPGQTRHPELAKRVEQVIAVCQKYQISVGIFAGNAADMLMWQQKGIQFLTYSLVSSMLYNQALAATQELRGNR